MKNFKLLLPDDFDDYAWEVEAKGWFNNAVVEFEGKRYRLTFYDLARLSQDIEEELSTHAAFIEQNIVVLKCVTREAMQRALEFLTKSGGFNQLKAETP